MREHVENVELYKPGGYHPIDIGDAITNGDDTYTVAHKLGHGGFSTVWLVKRSRKHSLPSFHALKIHRADVGDERVRHELDVLHRLGQLGRSSHPNIVMVEDSFTISGPNGQHRCLVLPLLALSLHSIKVKTLTLLQRHRICQQLASAVAFLHSHGVCHGGTVVPRCLPVTVNEKCGANQRASVFRYHTFKHSISASRHAVHG
jgi:serine/threonine protein kinase